LRYIEKLLHFFVKLQILTFHTQQHLLSKSADSNCKFLILNSFIFVIIRNLIA
jgi:hypothetical protein